MLNESMKADLYGALSDEIKEALNGIFEEKQNKIHEMYVKGLLTASESKELNGVVVDFIKKYF